jgi:hypothetical protein
MLDPRAVARELDQAPPIIALWDTNVLPTVQPYIEHTTPDQLDPGYLYRVGEFMEEVLLISELRKPGILPDIANEASGMMGGLARRAKKKAKDAPADLAQTLLWIAQNAQGIHDKWRAIGKDCAAHARKEPTAPLSRCVRALRTLMDRLPWAEVENKLRPYSNADKELASVAIAHAIVLDRTLRVYSRDQDILVLVRNTVTALVGYAGLQFDAPDSLSVWKFFNKEAREKQAPTFRYEPFWSNALIKIPAAKRHATRVRKTTGVTQAMDAVIQAVK